MSTPLSSATAYATAAQMLVRYDVRVLGDLVGESGRVSSTGLLTDPNLAAALLDASGHVESAVVRGGRYTPADLAALTGASQQWLVRLTCRVAMILLQERRDPKAALPEWAKDTREELDRLSRGERIFGLQEAVDAGVADDVLPPDAEPGPRPALSETARRFFGRRSRTEPGE